MAHLLGSLAARAAAHWKRSLGVVAFVLVAVGVLAGTFGGTFSDDFKTPGTESQSAYDLLQQRFPAQSGDTATTVFSVSSGKLTDGQRPAAIKAALAEIAKQPDVVSAADPLATPKGGQVSRDGRIAFSTVQYSKRAVDLGKEAGLRLEAATGKAAVDGISVAQNGQVVDQAEQGSAPIGEIVGVAVAIIVLTIVFHSAAAMVLTLVSAFIALGVGLLLLTFGSRFIDFPSFAPTLGVMLGLGAGIDYALLIVGRYREQLAAGDDVPHAARVANSTAGVSVVAAGVIVVVAVAGLLATGIPFVGRMGVGSALVVACVAIGAVTVLPTFMGTFARRLRPKDPSHVAPSARFAGWATRLTDHPWRAALGGTLILLVLAYPATQLRLGQPDDGNDGKGTTTRKAYDKLAEGFGPGFNGPLVLAADVPAGSGGKATVARLQRAVAATPGVQLAAPPAFNQAGTAATIAVIPRFSPQDERTSELVARLRDTTVPTALRGSPVRAYLGGATATFEDLSTKIADRLPIFILLVVGLSIVLLMAVFRSIWVPLISAVFNLFSIVAAYGVIVAVFQWGWGASLFGSEGDLPIVSFVPLFMFAILFGLSMDYNVFLSSRIREEHLRGHGPADSVIIGMSRVAKVILAAGTIMTAVFLGFVTGSDIIIKLIGFGLASAIAIDVLIVRMIVAPAVIMLLGDRAWWMPAWLDRILPTISLEGDVEHPPAAAEDEAAERDRPAVTA